jgi:drug/metabolite transporter (DMT)-like permease
MTISTAGYPLVAGGLALWWFDERITRPLAVGSIVALAGLVLIVSESESGGAVPDSTEGRRHGLRLAVVAALAWAVSAALMKPPVREIEPDAGVRNAREPPRWIHDAGLSRLAMGKVLADVRCMMTPPHRVSTDAPRRGADACRP